MPSRSSSRAAKPASPVATRLAVPVLDVLSRCTVTTAGVTLPDQLDRELYLEVNRVLAALGGKWNRGKKVHVFADLGSLEVAERVAACVDTGVYVNPRHNDLFQTPVDMALRLARHLEPATGEHFLEPSAGMGRLAVALLGVAAARGANDVAVDCVELLPDCVTALRRIQRESSSQSNRIAAVVQGDFLATNDGWIATGYDGVLMNPPFGGSAYVEHIRKALDLLRPGGRLVAIAPVSIRTRQDSRPAALRRLLETVGAEITDNAPDAFRESGTLCRTVTITVNCGGGRLEL